MIFTLRAGLAALILVTLSTAAAAQAPAAPSSRAEAVAIIADARKILTPNGVERLEKVRIGGIEQWVSIRGTDRRNPVLIVIHGGPGYVAMPQSWWYGRGWEEYFTVVHWDQRGSGKTYLLTDPKLLKPTLTLDQMLADADELVGWTRRTLGKDKVFVLAHSAGTYLGLHVAQTHPEWLHAYIGVGQMTDILEGERRSWRFALDAARKEGNAPAIRDLEALAPYAAPGKPPTIDALYTQRRWVQHYGGAMAYRTGSRADSALASLSPDYSDEESQRVWEGNEFIGPILLPQMLARDLDVTRIDVPVILFSGRHDTNVNSQVGAEWLDRLQAPEKHLVWFEHSAHLPMTEEPGKFLVSLLRYARPIAERAGDIPPAAD